MNDVVILIPPSEGKQKGGTYPALKKVSRHVKPMIDQLLSVKQIDWQKILGVKNKALEEAILDNKNILTSKSLPAIERYTGVVYDATDYASLTKKQQEYFDNHVRIVSAVFGLVKPRDLIPPYKLKIDKLGADKYWRPINAKMLSSCFVIDLLPQAHKKAVEYNEGVTIDFYFMKNGKKVPAGHHGKHIKGRFVRFLCEHMMTNPAKFSKFTEEGFKYIDGNFIKHT